MEHLREEIENCRRCGLWKTRSQPVCGTGSKDAEVMLIGEAPGFNEDRTGKPFVGRAGAILDDMLQSVGMEREDIFIANILKCRPPKNRNPMPEEIAACTPYLDRQIAAIRPKTLCPMGNFAVSYVMEKFGLKSESVGKVHGRVYRIRNLILEGRIIPLYHPAAAAYNAGLKPLLMEDFRKVANE